MRMIGDELTLITSFSIKVANQKIKYRIKTSPITFYIQKSDRYFESELCAHNRVPVVPPYLEYHGYIPLILVFMTVSCFQKSKFRTLLAGAVKYTDCISAKVMPSNKHLGYDTKQYDDEAPVMLELWECRVSLHCHPSQVHSDLEC